MKKSAFALAVLLLLALLQPALGQEIDMSGVRYIAKMRDTGALLTQPDTDAPSLGYVSAGTRVYILEVAPDWLKIRTQKGQEGYMRRGRLAETTAQPLNPAADHAYAAVPCAYLGWAQGEAPVLAAPEAGAKALVTLYDGARIAFIDVTDGWARLIYHRQYGYVDTRQLKELLPLGESMAEMDRDIPLSAYTSFYKLGDAGSNLSRIINLEVACERFGLYILAPGDKLDFNAHIGPYNRQSGYQPANVIVAGEIAQGYGGGTCQVSSTLYNTILQLPQIGIIHRRAHGPSGASYLPHGADAAVGTETQNFIIQNRFPYAVRIDGTVQDGALTIALYRAD
ncbi:MAG: VanW family protein [Eubacteriales bacterium]|nr:VanW family protein [Eubacteriales bacterium]